MHNGKDERKRKAAQIIDKRYTHNALSSAQRRQRGAQRRQRGAQRQARGAQ